jgi:AraC-like DNA-binding protein
MQIDQDTLERLSRARDLLCNVDDSSPSIREVARRAGISPFHFIRQFSAVFGATPHQYRTEARIAQAKQLLASDRLSVTAVCMEVGFSSLGTFSGLFTRWVGATPSEFRRRARTVVQVPSAVAPIAAADCLGMLAFLPPAAFRNFREASLA